MKTMLSLGCMLLIVTTSALSQQTVEQGTDGSGASKCTCYYSRDCSSGQTCGGYGDCAADGKKDGSCSKDTPAFLQTPAIPLRDRVPLNSKRDSGALYAAVDAYFQAFLKAIERGGGRPDSKLLQVALNTPISKARRERVEYGVWVSLDAVMGWDFMYPSQFLRSSGYVGNIREVNGVKSAAGIVDAARRGMLNAIQSGDATEIDKPLKAFWLKNPGYLPHHLGRCYPHGHAEVTNLTTSVACQVDTLERVATMLIKVSSSKEPLAQKQDLKLETRSR